MDHDFQKQIVEALIFASDIPISAKKIADFEEELDSRKIKKIVEALNADYQKNRRAFFIANVAGGFQLNTRKEFEPWLKKLFKGRLRTRLSQASLESLAIITFKQPISRVEVDAIRGVNSGGVIKNLLERSLICIAGRSEGQGKPLLYGTTKEFLRYFGINDITDLPKPKEIEEIMGRLDQEDGIGESIIETLTEMESSEDESNHKDDSAQ